MPAPANHTGARSISLRQRPIHSRLPGLTTTFYTGLRRNPNDALLAFFAKVQPFARFTRGRRMPERAISIDPSDFNSPRSRLCHVVGICGVSSFPSARPVVRFQAHKHAGVIVGKTTLLVFTQKSSLLDDTPSPVEALPQLCLTLLSHRSLRGTGAFPRSCNSITSSHFRTQSSCHVFPQNRWLTRRYELSQHTFVRR